MRLIHKIISGALLLALAAGFIIVYKRNKTEIIQNPNPPAQDTQVKGETKTAPAENEVVSRLPLTPANIVWYTNYYRAKNHLPALIQRKALNESAKAKTTNMLLYQYFDHTQPGGTVGFDHFIDDQQYDFIKIGENLAMGDFTTSKEVVDAWMKSPAHMKNILDTTYTEIGVSVQKGIMKGKEVVLITEHFGKPRKSCPSINESTKTAIDSLTDAVKKTQDEISAKQQVIENPQSVHDSTYQTLVGEYNRLVDAYNVSASQLGALVASYNDQVRAFDTCISK